MRMMLRGADGWLALTDTGRHGLDCVTMHADGVQLRATPTDGSVHEGRITLEALRAHAPVSLLAIPVRTTDDSAVAGRAD